LTIYLDNAATTYPKPERVYRAADEFYRRYGGNAGRGGNPLAKACARLLADAREQTAVWLNAPAPERVIFTASATHALNLAILGASLRPGDALYATPLSTVFSPAPSLVKKRQYCLVPSPASISSAIFWTEKNGRFSMRPA